MNKEEKNQFSDILRENPEIKRNIKCIYDRINV